MIRLMGAPVAPRPDDVVTPGQVVHDVASVTSTWGFWLMLAVTVAFFVAVAVVELLNVLEDRRILAERMQWWADGGEATAAPPPDDQPHERAHGRVKGLPEGTRSALDADGGPFDLAAIGGRGTPPEVSGSLEEKRAVAGGGTEWVPPC